MEDSIQQQFQGKGIQYFLPCLTIPLSNNNPIMGNPLFPLVPHLFLLLEKIPSLCLCLE
jgi:hypothetical protein